jgi:hypothetical protein
MVQKRCDWNARAELPLLSWTLANPSVVMLTTSPADEATLRTVFDRPRRVPSQPGSD